MVGLVAPGGKLEKEKKKFAMAPGWLVLAMREHLYGDYAMSRDMAKRKKTRSCPGSNRDYRNQNPGC